MEPQAPKTAATLDQPDLIRILPLGGLGEIGMNLMVLEHQGRMLLIDCGLMFPEAHMLGIDLVLPDISAIEPQRERICGIVVTHGHEDHIGALPFLYERLGCPPLLATPFTLELIHKRFEQQSPKTRLNSQRLQPRTPVVCGPFTIEPFRVAHSIPDGIGLAIRTEAGIVLHSGDFKLDATPLDGQCTDLATLGRYGEEGVLLLLSDSTNAEQAGSSGSERQVGPALRRCMEQTTGMVFLACFSSNIHRLQQAADAARAAGRKIVLHGRSLIASSSIARILGLLRIPDADLIDLRQARQLPRQRVAVLTTGSQGEPRSALARIASGEHADLAIEPGDGVILSSRVVPGNEKATTSLINQLYRHGAEVFSGAEHAVHVSGHAASEELKQLIALTRPRYLLPIHGEYRHLVRHARLGRDCGLAAERCLVIENGQPLLLSRHGVRREEPVENGRVFVDGKGVGDLGDVELRDRHQLASQGTLIAVIGVDKKNGHLLFGPELTSRGLLPENDDSLLSEAAAQIRQLLTDQHLDSGTNWEELRIDVRRTLKRFFKKTLQRQPLVLPIIIQL
ncbi:MAG: ribonuclease J [Desulfuromonadaceae bacterium]|nr:ribonuclease J [Desulfuromonadaceae bacterium]